MAITRSGTTTEVLEILAELKGGIVPTVAIIGDTSSPIVELADTVVGLHYADERSVVQTRFATTALVYMLTSLGIDVQQAIEDARDAVTAVVSQELLDAEQFTFLGTGWTVGLAHEAGLKMREAVQGWTESYPAMEYRHGPISIAAPPGRVTWLFGTQPEGLDSDMAVTGALYIHTDKHPPWPNWHVFTKSPWSVHASVAESGPAPPQLDALRYSRRLGLGSRSWFSEPQNHRSCLSTLAGRTSSWFGGRPWNRPGHAPRPYAVGSGPPRRSGPGQASWA